MLKKTNKKANAVTQNNSAVTHNNKIHSHFALFIGLFVAFVFFVPVGQTQENDQALQPLEEVVIPLLPNLKSQQSDTEILASVRDYLNTIKTLNAHFSQQGPDGKIVSGTLSLERPGKVRFEYDGDVPILIVSDGQILNLIDYDIGQVTKWPVYDTPLAVLLANQVQFNDHTIVSSRQNDVGMGFLAITASDPKNPQQGSLTLIFSQQQTTGMQLRAWQVVDAQGNLTTVSLSKMALNSTLNNDLWTFNDPRGQRITRSRRR